MTTLRQAAQQALEALQMSIPKPRPADDDYAELGWKEHNAAITALRAALAEPEQEPVAWISEGGDVSRSRRYMDEMGFKCEPLYTAPTPRKPLTLEHIFDGAMATLTRIQKDDWVATDQDIIEFARAIERVHGIGEQHE